MPHSEDEVIEYLREVNDPELGINLVDLGLIRGVELDERSVTVIYTLTTPACPLNEYIDAEMDEVLKRKMPDIQTVIPILSWEPLWNPSMMSEDAKFALGGSEGAVKLRRQSLHFPDHNVVRHHHKSRK